MKQLTVLFFLILGKITCAQEITSCQFTERFAEDHYFYVSQPNDNLSTTEIKKKLVSSIFSLIKNESKLELTNIDGESTSDFSQLSIVKSEAFLINPNQCQKNNGALVVYISKRRFNASFLSDYFSKIVLLKKRITSLQTSDLRRESTFLKKDIINIKSAYERLRFYLPFANSIANITYDGEIKSIYESLTQLEIYSLSTEDRVLKIEQDYLIMDCKQALQQIRSIGGLELNKNVRKRLRGLKKNIETNCALRYNKALKLAKDNSSLFNNLELALYVQSYPINTSNQIPNADKFNLESPFLAGRINYFIGISDLGLRVGPYFKFFYLSGAILSDEANNIDFSDSFSEVGLTIRHKLIDGLLQFELSVGRSLNEINPIANSNIQTFNFITVSPGFILGTSKRLSFILGADYLAADNKSNYKYLTAKLGLNYNILFKKINKSERRHIKSNYEIKS